MVVLENVVGTISAKGGEDFRSILRALSDEGYWYAPIVADAAHFLPQSRPRLFIVAGQDSVSLPRKLTRASASPVWHPGVLARACEQLTPSLARRWIWLDMAQPEAAPPLLEYIIEASPQGIRWHTRAETSKLLKQMLPSKRRQVEQRVEQGAHVVGTVCRRTRRDTEGTKVQRAEIRFDGIAGCLRTPVGGSSRQIVVVVQDGEIKSRLLSPREAARLMGIPETYVLPDNYNEAYHLMGDGVAVPVVSWINSQVLLPLARQTRRVAAA